MSQDRSFDPAVKEKAERLCSLLADFHVHPFLGTRLVLKGGTALNLFYLDVPRLSVDIDVNYVGAPDRAQMLVERPEVERAVSLVARGRGYEIQADQADQHAGCTLRLAYRNAFGLRDSIKVDINYMYRLPFGAAVEKVASFPVLSGTVFTVVSFAELVGGKLAALLDRLAPRDLYDAASLAASVNQGESLSRAVFVAMAGVLPLPLDSYGIARLDRITDRSIESTLHPVLASEDRPSAGELRARVYPWLTRWLTLDEREREFHQRLAGGELRGDVLFPNDPVLAACVDVHPALRWKAQNAAQWRARGGTAGRRS